MGTCIAVSMRGFATRGRGLVLKCPATHRGSCWHDSDMGSRHRSGGSIREPSDSARPCIKSRRGLRTRRHLANSALRKWVQRFAYQGPQGLFDRPRSGRPPKVTCELEQHLNRLVDQDPVQHGSLHSQWSCRALATVLAHQTGVQLSRESVRCALKKRT